jgi:hypothetical protein
MAFQLPGSPFPMKKTTKGSGEHFRTTEEGAGMTSKGVADSTREKTQVAT